MNSSYLFADHGCNSKEESFWRILIQDYHFGYTLFGNKPISFDRYYISPSIDMPACCKKNAKLEVLWDFWEQNNPHISESPFVLKRVKFTEDKIEFTDTTHLIDLCTRCTHHIKINRSGKTANSLQPKTIHYRSKKLLGGTFIPIP